MEETTVPKIVLVGESNPYGGDDKFAPEIAHLLGKVDE